VAGHLTPEEAATHVELRSLVERYAAIVDAFDYDAYPTLFTPDATFIAFGAGADEPFFRAEGADELAQAVHANDGFEQTYHAIHNHTCAIDGDRGSGVTYCLARHLLRSEGGALESIVVPLRYHDTYARTDEGWKFAAREIRFTWVERIPVDPDGLAVWAQEPDAVDQAG
jgi:3-phenylpropionate/cinnamic acid dioxygenase small subunit